MTDLTADRISWKDHGYLTCILFAITCLQQGTLNGYFALCLGLLGIGTVLRFWRRPTIGVHPSWFTIWFCCLWGYIFLNGFLSPAYFGWRTLAVYVLPVVCVMIFYAPYYDSKALWAILRTSCVWTTVLFLGYIIVFELPNILSGSTRIGDSASGNVNSVAISLCYFSIVIFYSILFENRRRLIPLLLVTFGFVLLTGSKKGLLGIVCVLGLLSICRYKWRVYKYAVPVVVLVVVGYLLSHSDYMYNILGRRLDVFYHTLTGENTAGSTAQRIGMYEIGWLYFKQAPLFGNGLGYFAQNSVYQTYSHNNYIELLVSCGLCGFLLYYSFFVLLLKKGWNLAKSYPMSYVFVSLILLRFIFDFASVSFYTGILYYIFLFFGYKILKHLGKNYEKKN